MQVSVGKGELFRENERSADKRDDKPAMQRKEQGKREKKTKTIKQKPVKKSSNK